MYSRDIQYIDLKKSCIHVTYHKSRHYLTLMTEMLQNCCKLSNKRLGYSIPMPIVRLVLRCKTMGICFICIALQIKTIIKTMGTAIGCPTNVYYAHRFADPSQYRVGPDDDIVLTCVYNSSQRHEATPFGKSYCSQCLPHC